MSFGVRGGRTCSCRGSANPLPQDSTACLRPASGEIIEVPCGQAAVLTMLGPSRPNWLVFHP
jgi:hypothetical protein